MSVLRSRNWEAQLLLAAQEALNSHSLAKAFHAESERLLQAYTECETVTRFHSRTFHMASGLLPLQKRQAARALYAFCRVTDDIVDDPVRTTAERSAALSKWQAAVMADEPAADDLVCLAWADAQVNFNIPRGYAQQLIDGCARDISQTRYQTFADLAAYSYGVASTVGLMAMHIVGYVNNEETLPYAVRLGVALQLTNILRDVAEDWANGRLYLPLDELADFGLSEADIAAGQVTENWRAFMAFQIERNRQLYDESIPGLAYLDQDGRFAIGAAAELYKAILDDIEAHEYDVFSRRAHVTTAGKMSLLPGIWWRSRQANR